MAGTLTASIRTCVLAVLCVVLPSAEVLAQYMAFPMIPTGLSAGLGATFDLNPSKSASDFNFGLTWVYVRDQWIEPAIEMGVGPASDEALCRDEGPVARPETCSDAYMTAGLRLRPYKESDRLWRPFVHLLLGSYWTGTGLKDPDFLPGVFTLQPGGGIDIRSPESIHGLRLSGDYRHVFAEGRGRHQLQFVVSYFVGWRGAESTRSQPAPTVLQPDGGVSFRF